MIGRSREIRWDAGRTWKNTLLKEGKVDKNKAKDIELKTKMKQKDRGQEGGEGIGHKAEGRK